MKYDYTILCVHVVSVNVFTMSQCTVYVYIWYGTC